MSDKEILALMCSDNEEGLDRLIIKYGALVKTVVGYIVRNTSDCEEAVSDTFYKVWKNRCSIDLSRKSLKNYVCMSARSCAVDKVRGIGRHDNIDIEGNDIGVDVDYTDETAKKINQQIIIQCIKAMRSPDREIFIDRYYFRMSVKDIAVRRRLNVKKVENILFRSKKKLKKALLDGGIIL